MFRRGVQAAVLGVIVVVMMGAGSSRFDKLGHQMMCVCGCSEILLECNHVGCPDSDRMIGELRAQLAGGGGSGGVAAGGSAASGGLGDTGILNWFAAKYGPIVLAAPIRGGFDNVAWIAPIAVFLLATIGTAIVVWVWKRRTSALALAGGAGMANMPGGFASGSLLDDAIRERIRRETEY